MELGRLWFILELIVLGGHTVGGGHPEAIEGDVHRGSTIRGIMQVRGETQTEDLSMLV